MARIIRSVLDTEYFTKCSCCDSVIAYKKDDLSYFDYEQSVGFSCPKCSDWVHISHVAEYDINTETLQFMR